jgi:CelD/BcsL family acetyltransferase involved in cellulose biosynthesis
MTAPTLDTEPACPGLDEAPADHRSARSSDRGPIPTATRRPFRSIPRATWDGLAAQNPWATPFARHAFHAAWWDAYRDNAHEETLVLTDPEAAPDDPGAIRAIVPLMHRHEVEASDALTHTKMRHGHDLGLTPVPPTAKATFFGASYHADYATVLAAPDDLPRVAQALADYFDGPDSGPWDAIDLRRLRCGDPTADALADALGAREIRNGWRLNLEREDVCPVVTFEPGSTVDDYLQTLGKKERHEIRRKVRRAEAVGPIVLTDSEHPLDDLETFIDLHQKRWGADGLFPPTPGGDQSRVLFRRLFEGFDAEPDRPLRLSFLTVGERRIAAGIHFETEDGYLYYNAGIDPDARELSPGVLMVYAYVERALASGKRRMDFLRGDEPYKYEWGAVDEPIQRLLVRRTS